MNKKYFKRMLIVLLAGLMATFPLVAETMRAAVDDFKIFEISDQQIIPESQAYKTATEKLISYFKDEFMKGQEFTDSFGDLEWEDVSEEVIDSVDITRDRKWEDAHYHDKAFAFVGRIFGLYASIAVDKATGAPKDIYIELDDF